MFPQIIFYVMLTKVFEGSTIFERKLEKTGWRRQVNSPRLPGQWVAGLDPQELVAGQDGEAQLLLIFSSASLSGISWNKNEPG